MTDDRQIELFPDLSGAPPRARRRPPVLYPRAAARRQLIEKMSRKGCLVREIVAAAKCTKTHVLRVRQELRAAGRLPETPRSAAARAAGCDLNS